MTDPTFPAAHHGTPAATEPPGTHAPCGGCALADAVGRRAFLRDAAGVAAALLALLGATPAVAAALPVRLTGALARRGPELRYPVPAADGAEIDREHEVILVRYQGAAYAFNLSCPHQNTALRWLAAEGRFQCPKHKSRYRPDGVFISGRATRGMDRFPIRLDGPELAVDADTLLRQDEARDRWETAVAKL
jgi:Rieske Fe-S protein